MSTHLDTLRRIHARDDYGPFHEIDPDLDREAGMDGNYARLLQAARDLDAAAPAPTTEHTPEPWSFVEDGGGSAFSFEIRADRRDHGGQIRGIALVYADNPDDGSPGTEDTANAARIVQCVNACAGLDNPAEAIRAAREALLATLDYLQRPSVRDQVLDALALLEGAK